MELLAALFSQISSPPMCLLEIIENMHSTVVTEWIRHNSRMKQKNNNNKKKRVR